MPAGGGGPRRLPWEARYQQLTAAAMPIVADQGFADFSLDEVTSRAGVTRKLLYHYFPRGRPDVVLAVAERAGHQLTDDWIIDETIPLPERLAANNARMIEHAMGPTDAWRIYRLARASGDPELSDKVGRFVDIVVSSVALNQLGAADPPPLARLAIRAYLAFFESALDDARNTDVPIEQVTRVLGDTLTAAMRVPRTETSIVRQARGRKPLR
jgi:AcrR family transcriptional regulator